MACLHKFHQYLNLDNLNFEPTTLIVGTFNPGWDGINNNADWFYGRTRNNYFWDVVPRIYENINLRNGNNMDWKDFCVRNQIALTDLLESINDADENNPLHVTTISNYKDSDIANSFQHFTPVDIINILNNNPSIRNVYLTRQLGIAFWDNLWNIIVNENTGNNINFQTLLTPSASARFQMNGIQGIRLQDFIFNKWQAKWHQITHP
jgi:hypothetical protein